jgi:shikimate kinase
MSTTPVKLAITGFMGVGKSSVARHLAQRLRVKWVDLDRAIEVHEKRSVAEIINAAGVDAYRAVETANLERVLTEGQVRILSLGGGTWTVKANRDLLKAHGFATAWLESTFEHSWLNITFSRKERPLARDKKTAKKLFDERQDLYRLAEWHFVVRPNQTSLDVAKKIVDEMF